VNYDGTAGKASILITGINAPDGIAVDDKGTAQISKTRSTSSTRPAR
jgi:hypothetical protein